MKTTGESVKEYAYGIAGGLIFSLPLMYTMEMWWTGQSIPPYRMLIYLAVTFLLLLGYNRYAGLHPAASWAEVWTDSIEEIGIGLCLSFIVLLSLGQLSFSESSLEEIVGRIVMQAMPAAIGISIGTAQLGVKDKEQQKKESRVSASNKNPQQKIKYGRFVLALCGSVVIAGNIAPTEEVRLIASRSTPFSLIALILHSLILGGAILFFSDFNPSRRTRKTKVFSEVLAHTFIAYLAALTASYLMLWFFGQLNGHGLYMNLASIIVLGFPGMLGASAGRLLIKNES